jgi:hypothetical protein
VFFIFVAMEKVLVNVGDITQFGMPNHHTILCWRERM